MSSYHELTICMFLLESGTKRITGSTFSLHINGNQNLKNCFLLLGALIYFFYYFITIVNLRKIYVINSEKSSG